MSNWLSCKKILVIRPDNMGDLLMSTPAIRALKQTFGAHITVLTSSMAAGIAALIPDIDDTIIFDVPWVKTNQSENNDALLQIVEMLKRQHFDAAVILTVYSQNPLPTVMLAYMAGIPLRLAYCRENPYHLLTNWIPDPEPYQFIRHQVRRDLDLVASVGAHTTNETLILDVPDENEQLKRKLQSAGVDANQKWVIMHPGVSEIKRAYPVEHWAKIARKAVSELGYQVIFTGAASEHELAAQIQSLSGEKTFNLAGKFSLKKFVSLIQQAPLVVSVNTGTIHIAAAVNTPVVVLYALTNPQHTPWKVSNQILAYSVPKDLQSKNEVINYVNQYFNLQNLEMPNEDEVIQSMKSLLDSTIDSSLKQVFAKNIRLVTS